MAADDLESISISFGAGPELEDPKPKTTSKSRSSRPVGRPSRDARIKEIAEEMGGFLKVINLATMARDMHEVWNDDETEIIGYASCMSVYVGINAKTSLPELTPQGAEFCDAFAHIAIDNKFLMKLIDGGDSANSWLRLAFALQPLIMTVISNHSFRRNRDVPADEQVD